MAIPRTLLRVVADRLMFNATLYDQNGSDTFTGLTATNYEKWLPIVLKAATDPEPLPGKEIPVLDLPGIMAIRKVHGNNDNILNLRDHEKNKILILLVIGLSLGSCVQTDDEAFSPEPTVKGGEKSITAICAVTATTRTSLNASMNVVWTQNDEIRLFGTSTPNGAVYTTAANSVRTAVFDPVDASVDDAIRYAIYPRRLRQAASLKVRHLLLTFRHLPDRNGWVHLMPIVKYHLCRWRQSLMVKPFLLRICVVEYGYN